METAKKGNAGIVIVLILLLGLVVLFVLPKELPALEGITTRSHAVEQHGQDALDARAQLRGCREGLRIRLCPASELHGASVCFWCETGANTCPGMYTTISGIEKTAFFRPCEQWRRCQ